MSRSEALNSLHFCDPWPKIESMAHRVVLFGAGNKGRKALRQLRSRGVSPLAFCDNSLELQGKTIDGVPIVSYRAVREQYTHYLALLTTSVKYAHQIEKQLREAGELNEVIHFCPPFKVSTGFRTRQEVDVLLASLDRIRQLFKDEHSKKVFEECIRYKTTGSGLQLSTLSCGSTFFDEELISQSNHHHYVDVGAYTGDTIMQFCQFCRGRYKRIDAFELDKGNFSKLQRFLLFARLEEVFLYNVGLWREACMSQYHTLDGSFEEGFENPNLFSSVHGILDYDFNNAVSNSDVRAVTQTCELETLDRHFEREQPTLVKINALGSDLEVLEGGKALLAKRKPSLVLEYGSEFHHLAQVPQTILSANSSYRLYLRQKEIFGDSKTILYAI